MKITVSQLRRIIREEVEKVTEGSRPFGGVYNYETGEMLDMDSVPPQYLRYVDKNKSEEVEGKEYQAFIQGDKFEELRDKLIKIPYWEVVLRTFETLRGPDGEEVPLEDLEARLGEPVKSWNGTGLRVIDGVVTELLGDTPYRTDR
jgi:hypothetical protein